jgi:hypothetical protein
MPQTKPFPFKSVAECLKVEGDKETLSLLKRGYRDREYRKARNMENDTLLELAKKDTKMVEAAKAQLAKELAKS